MISLADLQRRIDAGELSADAAIAQSREAIGAHEKTIGAFVCHDRKSARAKRRAAARHRGRHQGHHRHRGFPDRDGFADLRGFRPRGDAAVVMMLKQAGASIIGKTTTTAFASIDPTATLNPHNTATRRADRPRVRRRRWPPA